MINFRKIGVGLIAAAALVAVVSLAGQLQPKTYAANTIFSSNDIVTVSGTTDGLPPNDVVGKNGYSADTNVIVFRSNATNLPNAGGPGGLYTYNIKTNTISRIDISNSGVVANSGVTLEETRVSETGRYVLFMTRATNLVDGATQPSNYYVTYVRDTQAGTTKFVDSQIYGTTGNQNKNLTISDDGKFVLIASRYIANFSYPHSYGIAYGTSSGTGYTWNSLSKGGDLENNDVNATDWAGRISCDGSFAVYQHFSSIELADFRSGVIKTVISSGNSGYPVISCSGRYILYLTKNRTEIPITPSGMNLNYHLVRYDRITGERIYIDTDSTGVVSAGIGTLSQLSIADTGDVVFNYNGYQYLKHLSDNSGTLETVGKTVSGANANVQYARISSDGRYIMMLVDPYTLGLASSPSDLKYVRVKSGI